MKGSFTVYILKNSQGRRYTGITSDIQKRLMEHNSQKSFYTKRSDEWHLHWTSIHMSHTDALKLEKLIKKQKGGSGLISLLERYTAHNPAHAGS